MTLEAQDYTAKQPDYFHGERRDFIDKLDRSSTRQILEIGCGDGATGAYAKREGKCGRYIGVELVPEAARIAGQVLDQVFVANIETFDLPDQCGLSDVLIASEVLEHLIDPLTVLRKLRKRLASGALVFASSPNIAHHSTLRMLIAGRWDLPTAAAWTARICAGSRRRPMRRCSKTPGSKFSRFVRLFHSAAKRGWSTSSLETGTSICLSVRLSWKGDAGWIRISSNGRLCEDKGPYLYVCNLWNVC